MRLTILLSAVFLWSCNRTPKIPTKPVVYADSLKPEVTVAKNLTLSEIIQQRELRRNRIHLVVDKSDKKLMVYYKDELLKTFHVVLGSDELNDKLQEGDRMTPEGKFTIKQKYPHAKWKKFMWIDYPTRESWRKHRKAKRTGSIAENAKIGGEVGIHGVPAGCDHYIDDKINWTLGCISLRNKDVEEIYQAIEVGTTIFIRK